MGKTPMAYLIEFYLLRNGPMSGAMIRGLLKRSGPAVWECLDNMVKSGWLYRLPGNNKYDIRRKDG